MIDYVEQKGKGTEGFFGWHQEKGAEGYAVMKKAVLDILPQHFRPEFLNRIDEIVVFHPLEKTQIRAIATIQIERLQQRLKEQELMR